MRPVTPEPLPAREGRRVSTDSRYSKKSKAKSARKRKNHESNGRDIAGQPIQAPEIPDSWSPFTNFMTNNAGAAGLPAPKQIKVHKTQQDKRRSIEPRYPPSDLTDIAQAQYPSGSGGIAAAPTEKPNGGFSGLFEKNPRRAASADETDAGRATKDATGTDDPTSEPFVTAEDTNVPFSQAHSGTTGQVKIRQGSMSEEAKAAALKRYEAMLDSGEADSFTMFMDTENSGALDAVVELPPARAHSLSEDTVLVPRPAYRERHSLSSDALMASGRPGMSHTLARDKVINATPFRGGGHRLSTDAMIPVRIAPPGHYLDADPTVSSPQNLFSHELLEDVRVLRPKSPQAHSLEMDKKLAMLHKQMQPHDIHNDIALPTPVARAAHELEYDHTVNSGITAQGSHDIEHDQVVASGAGARGGHDIVHDVRIVSPGSGQVRDPHSVDEDEIVKETTLFRKSPQPDAMLLPGNWNSSATGVKNDVNSPIASLNVSLQSANQALDELNRVVGTSESGKENAVSGM